MNEQRQPISPRRRLQELQAIPERDRTDAQWDELNELEITLSSANRADRHEKGGKRDTPPVAPRPKSGGEAPAKKPFRKFHKRPPKGKTPAS